MASVAMLVLPGPGWVDLRWHGDLGDRVRLGPAGPALDQAQGHRGGAARPRSQGAAPEHHPDPRSAW
ncbi:hypothetical protein LV779_16345 [Streptomyces thinghirensis]|nr:hypothetical protein [Streptomyces thinghirensis]